MTAASNRALVRQLTVAAALGLAPAVWFAHLLLSYLLVPVACEWGTTLPLHATTAAAAVVAFGGSAMAVGARQVEEGSEGRDAIAFLLRAGTITSLVFGTIILLAGAANVLVDPC